MDVEANKKTGIELMAVCGYNTEHLLEEDAEAFWTETFSRGISSPRKPMEKFAEALRKKRLQSKSDLSR